DLLGVDLYDRVLDLEARRSSRPVGQHFADDGAMRLLEAEVAGKVLVDVLDLHSEPAAADSAALLELLDDPLDGIRRHREGDTDAAARGAVDRGVHAHHVALEVDRGAARVAVVHGGVDLHVIVRAADVAGERRDDAGGHSAAKTERIADSKHPVANA